MCFGSVFFVFLVTAVSSFWQVVFSEGQRLVRIGFVEGRLSNDSDLVSELLLESVTGSSFGPCFGLFSNEKSGHVAHDNGHLFVFVLVLDRSDETLLVVFAHAC